MQAHIEVSDFDRVICGITQAVEELTKEVRALKRQNNNEWLNASDFCKRYKISRPTLYKRAKQGFIEVCNFGGDINRYKMKEDNNGK